MFHDPAELGLWLPQSRKRLHQQGAAVPATTKILFLLLSFPHHSAAAAVVGPSLHFEHPLQQRAAQGDYTYSTVSFNSSCSQQMLLCASTKLSIHSACVCVVRLLLAICFAYQLRNRIGIGGGCRFCRCVPIVATCRQTSASFFLVVLGMLQNEPCGDRRVFYNRSNIHDTVKESSLVHRHDRDIVMLFRGDDKTNSPRSPRSIRSRRFFMGCAPHSSVSLSMDDAKHPNWMMLTPPCLAL